MNTLFADNEAENLIEQEAESLIEQEAIEFDAINIFENNSFKEG